MQTLCPEAGLWPGLLPSLSPRACVPVFTCLLNGNQMKVNLWAHLIGLQASSHGRTRPDGAGQAGERSDLFCSEQKKVASRGTAFNLLVGRRLPTLSGRLPAADTRDPQRPLNPDLISPWPVPSRARLPLCLGRFWRTLQCQGLSPSAGLYPHRTSVPRPRATGQAAAETPAQEGAVGPQEQMALPCSRLRAKIKV